MLFCPFVQIYSLFDTDFLSLLDLNAARQRSLSKLFTSKTGTEVLATSVCQFSQTRFSSLRDLYLLQVAAIRLGDQVNLLISFEPVCDKTNNLGF